MRLDEDGAHGRKKCLLSNIKYNLSFKAKARKINFIISELDIIQTIIFLEIARILILIMMI